MRRAYVLRGCVFVSLTAMLRLELPHINILTKMDMANRRDPGHASGFFREAQELHRIAPFCGVQPCSLDEDDVEEEPCRRCEATAKVVGKICELVDDFSLVCYEPLDVSDGESVAKVVRLLDKCNGHPCGVHAPQSLINDATELFLLHRGGTDGPSINVDGDNRGAAGRRIGSRDERRGRCGRTRRGRRRPALVKAGRGRFRGTPRFCVFFLLPRVPSRLWRGLRHGAVAYVLLCAVRPACARRVGAARPSPETYAASVLPGHIRYASLTEINYCADRSL